MPGTDSIILVNAIYPGVPDPGLPHGPGSLPPGHPDLPPHHRQLRLGSQRPRLLVEGGENNNNVIMLIIMIMIIIMFSAPQPGPAGSQPLLAGRVWVGPLLRQQGGHNTLELQTNHRKSFHNHWKDPYSVLGPSLGWKHLLALSHLRHYAKEDVKLEWWHNYHKGRAALKIVKTSPKVRCKLYCVQFTMWLMYARCISTFYTSRNFPLTGQ